MIGLNSLMASIQTAVTTGLAEDSEALNPQPLPPKASSLEVFANVKAALTFSDETLALPAQIPTVWHTELEDENNEPGAGEGPVADGPTVADGPPESDPPPPSDSPVSTPPVDGNTSSPSPATGAPENDPSGANGWVAGKSPDLSVVLDTDPRLAGRPNSVKPPDSQDADSYFGFAVKGNDPDGTDQSAQPSTVPNLKHFIKFTLDEDSDLMTRRR